MAETRTINVNIKNNADKTAKDFDNLNDSLDETAKANEQVNESFDTGATFAKRYGDAIEPLTTRMGEAEDRLYELALAGDTASQEYQELLTKVGEYRKVQIQTDLAVDGAATTMTQKLGSALNGATSGFAATQGAMALFGDENQALEESLLKVQSALAIQQGVQGLTEAYRELSIGSKLAAAGQAAFTFVTGGATTGLKLFRAALISTGVGALVVGIGLLVANFDKVKEVLTDVNKGFKEGGLLTKALMISFAPLIATVKVFQKGLKALGIAQGKNAEQEKADAKRREEEAKADEDRWNDKKDRLNKEYELKRKLAQKEIALAKAKGEETREAERKIITDAIADAEKNAKDDKDKFEEETRDTIDSIQKRIDAKKKAQKVIQKIEAEGIKDRSDLSVVESQILRNARVNMYTHTFEIERQLEASNKRLNEFRNKETKKWITTTKGDVESLQKDLEIFDAEEVKDNADKLKQKQEDRLNTARKIEDLENSLLKDGIEKELEINRDKFRRLQEDAKKNTKLTAKERAALKDLYDKQELAQQKVINKKYVDLEKEKNKKIDEEKAKANQERIDKEDALFQLELDLMKDRQMAEIIALSQSYEAKYLLAQDNAELTKQLEAQFLIDQAAIEDQFRLEKLAKDKEASDKQKDLIESERQARLEAIQKGLEYAQQGADAIQQIGDLVFSNKMAKLEEGSKEEEELARKQFKFNKAMQLGGAIIDAGKAITASLASAPIAIGPVPNPAGIASLAFAATTSAVNIAKIASTKFESTGDPADTPTPNIDESAAPNFNVVGDSGINQIAQLQQQPVQAFVVSGEVTTSQALDRNRVQNATL